MLKIPETMLLLLLDPSWEFPVSIYLSILSPHFFFFPLVLRKEKKNSNLRPPFQKTQHRSNRQRKTRFFSPSNFTR